VSRLSQLMAAADTEAWYGRLGRARELTREAAESAKHDDANEVAANYLALEVLREAAAGNRRQSVAAADAALKLAVNQDVLAIVATGLAQAGETTRAEALAVELDKQNPLNTFTQHYWLPIIRALLELKRKNPKKAVEMLRETTPYELGLPTTAYNVVLYPADVRGQAYLVQGDGGAAAMEFQKFVDNRGLVGSFLLGALARLGLARAYALQGNTAKARVAYQDFLTLWKDADPDISILRAAKAEYAKLQ
jgi:hypothetical protein